MYTVTQTGTLARVVDDKKNSHTKTKRKKGKRVFVNVECVCGIHSD